MFTDPELARVGLNESEASAQHITYRLARLPMGAVLRTRTTSEPRGFMKMLIDPGTDRILGFTVFGAEASELLATVQTAMLGNLPYMAVRDALYAHPTAAEGLTVLLEKMTRDQSIDQNGGRETHVKRSPDPSESSWQDQPMDRGAKEREIDQTLADSFPASDAPPWTLGVTEAAEDIVGRPKGRRG